MARPVGTVTRGTTNPNRLRRMDRWIAATHGAALRRATTPLAVDLGYGAAPWTAVELLRRLRAAAPRTQVVGVEIDPARVTAAQPYACEGLTFRHGGFEVPVPGRPTLIRAANVLRQYDEDEVAAVWERLCARLEQAAPPPPRPPHPTPGAHTPGPRTTDLRSASPHSPTASYPSGGLLVEGTCDEIGRRHVWVALGRRAPVRSPSPPGSAPWTAPPTSPNASPRHSSTATSPASRCTRSSAISTAPGRPRRPTPRTAPGSAGSARSAR